MGKEIERKFLVDEEKWRQLEKDTYLVLRQGYILNDDKKVIRVRIDGKKAFLTIKGKIIGVSRPEYEYQIPFADAINLLELFSVAEVSKVRYLVHFGGNLWEVDEFSGENEGLIIAEIELNDENQEFEKPEWIGKEVTQDLRYYNMNLAKKPFRKWKHKVARQ